LVVVEIEYGRRVRSCLRPGEELVAHHRISIAGAWRGPDRREAVGVRAAEALDAGKGRRGDQAVRDQLAVREVARRGRHRLLLVIDEPAGEVSVAVIEVAPQ